MCIFTGEVREVGDTSIFARLDGAVQYLAYQMKVAADAELAMVLPVPVPAGSAEDALRFIDLETYPTFFDDLHRLVDFPVTPPAASAPMSLSSLSAPPLAVHSVGAFDASFVPTLTDFSRLDPRFRLSDAVCSALPQYSDWGFAVFKLKPGALLRVHPMAMVFPTRRPDVIFFPTFHIHDGRAHAEASYDHVLYCQIAGEGPGRDRLADQKRRMPDLEPFFGSHLTAASFVKTQRTQGLVARELGVFGRKIQGRHRNQDAFVRITT